MSGTDGSGISGTNVGICGTNVGICGTDGWCWHWWYRCWHLWYRWLWHRWHQCWHRWYRCWHLWYRCWHLWYRWLVLASVVEMLASVVPMAVASVMPPGWLDCLTAIARVRVQRGLSQGRFSGLTRWDRMARTPPALCRPALTGPCLTTVVRAVGPGWSSPGSVLGLTGVTSLGNEVSPQCLGPGRRPALEGLTPGPCPEGGQAVCSRLSPIDTPLSHWE